MLWSFLTRDEIRMECDQLLVFCTGQAGNFLKKNYLAIKNSQAGIETTIHCDVARCGAILDAHSRESVLHFPVVSTIALPLVLFLLYNQNSDNVATKQTSVSLTSCQSVRPTSVSAKPKPPSTSPNCSNSPDDIPCNRSVQNCRRIRAGNR